MKLFIKLPTLFICLSLISCSSKAEDLLLGNWVIEKIEQNGIDIFEDIVIVNLMSIKDNGIILLPLIDSKLRYNKKKQYGRWEYLEDSYQLVIDSNSDYLNGQFNICFKKDLENNYIKLVLKSETLLFEAGKVLSEAPELTILPIKCDLDDDFH